MLARLQFLLARRKSRLVAALRRLLVLRHLLALRPAHQVRHRAQALLPVALRLISHLQVKLVLPHHLECHQLHRRLLHPGLNLVVSLLNQHQTLARCLQKEKTAALIKAQIVLNLVI